MARRNVVVVDKPDLQIAKQSSRGQGRGVTYLIHIPPPHGGPMGKRQLEVTIDQLFDLAEELDDICDHIEDLEEARDKNTDSNEEKLVV